MSVLTKSGAWGAGRDVRLEVPTMCEKNDDESQKIERRSLNF